MAQVGLSPRRSRFNSRPLRVGIVVDNATYDRFSQRTSVFPSMRLII